MGKGGTVNKLEPNSNEFCDQNAGVYFNYVGWYQFIQKFNGENYGISKTFYLSFNGVQVQVGSPGFEVTEESMVEVLSLPQTGEIWYKGQALGATDLNFFLKPKYHNPSWTKGVPKDWLRGKWKKVLIVVHK